MTTRPRTTMRYVGLRQLLARLSDEHGKLTRHAASLPPNDSDRWASSLAALSDAIDMIAAQISHERPEERGRA